MGVEKIISNPPFVNGRRIKESSVCFGKCSAKGLTRMEGILQVLASGRCIFTHYQFFPFHGSHSVALEEAERRYFHHQNPTRDGINPCYASTREPLEEISSYYRLVSIRTSGIRDVMRGTASSIFMANFKKFPKCRKVGEIVNPYKCHPNCGLFNILHQVCPLNKRNHHHL